MGRRRRRRRRRQRGGIIPLLLIAGKAIASSALSTGLKYGAKKALEKRRKKKIVRPPKMTFEEEQDIVEPWGYKNRVRVCPCHIGSMVRRGGRRRWRQHYQRGGIIPLLVPLAIAASKAIAARAVSGAAGYGVKKRLDAATRKKRVGKISHAQAEANMRRVRNMRRQWFKIAGVK